MEWVCLREGEPNIHYISFHFVLLFFSRVPLTSTVTFISSPIILFYDQFSAKMNLPTMSRSLTEKIHSNKSHGICQEVWRPNPWDYSNVLHKVCIVITMHFSQYCKRKWRNAISSKMCMYIFHLNFSSPVLIHLLNLSSFIHTYVST